MNIIVSRGNRGSFPPSRVADRILPSFPTNVENPRRCPRLLHVGEIPESLSSSVQLILLVVVSPPTFIAGKRDSA